MTDPGYKTKPCKYCACNHPATDQFWMRYSSSRGFKPMCRLEHNRRKKLSDAKIRETKEKNRPMDALLYLAVSAKWR